MVIPVLLVCLGLNFYQYNERTSVVEEKDGAGLIPNISYKIYF